MWSTENLRWQRSQIKMTDMSEIKKEMEELGQGLVASEPWWWYIKQGDMAASFEGLYDTVKYPFLDVEMIKSEQE